MKSHTLPMHASFYRIAPFSASTTPALLESPWSPSESPPPLHEPYPRVQHISYSYLRHVHRVRRRTRRCDIIRIADVGAAQIHELGIDDLSTHFDAREGSV